MKKVVVLAVLLFAGVGSLFAEDKDKRKKKSITDTIFRIDEVSVLEKRKRIDLLGLDVPLRFVPITVSKLSGQMLERESGRCREVFARDYSQDKSTGGVPTILYPGTRERAYHDRRDAGRANG